MLHFCPEQNSIQAVYTVCCRIVSNPVTVLYENVFRNKKMKEKSFAFANTLSHSLSVISSQLYCPKYLYI